MRLFVKHFFHMSFIIADFFSFSKQISRFSDGKIGIFSRLIHLFYHSQTEYRHRIIKWAVFFTVDTLIYIQIYRHIRASKAFQ